MAAAKKKTASRKKPPEAPRRRLFRPVLAAVLVVGALWVAFFDSHSLARRLGWHAEQARLSEENEALRRDIERLEAGLAVPISDELIEQIAREQYGMRRPGETIYRVEE